MGLPNISEFAAALGAGVRQNRFKVILTLPSGVEGDIRTFSLMVKSTNIPSMEVGQIEQKFKGKTIKLAGDYRPAGEWTVTALLEDATVGATAKRIADSWVALVKNEKDPAKYKSSGTIEIISAQADEHTVLKYKIEGVWIYNTGELTFDDESEDSFQTLDITFLYDDVEPIS